MTLAEAARRYLAAGLCVLPARKDQKRPTISWKAYQDRLPTESEVDAWFSNAQSALCVLSGRVSGHLELIDFDLRGERFDPWCAKVRAAAPGLLERLVLSETQSGGRHVAYRCPSGVSGNLKLAQRRLPDGQAVTLIETRGEGGLFLCAPTPGYRLIQGDLCDPPVLSEDERDVLLACAWELNECPPPVVDGPSQAAAVSAPGGLSAQGANNPDLSADSSHSAASLAENVDCAPMSADTSHTSACPPEKADRPGDDFNSRGDVRAVLQKHGWALAKPGDNEYWRRPGKASGTSATLKDRVFYVFSSNAAPFEPNRAYSPFAVCTLLDHGGDYEQAARALRLEGYGNDAGDSGVDISAIVAGSAGPGGPAPRKAGPPDPGPVPESLLYVPGFVGEMIDFAMAGAPYPSRGMAFCGAMAMQGHLCGRKVREPGDLRTNLYLLALGSSSAGKNYPRYVNSQLAIAANMTETLRGRFISGEGIEDRLEAQPSTLYQTDEIDGLLQSVNKAKDARYESIVTTLLTMYSSANMMYPMRSKAGKQETSIIHQPHLTVFGTATSFHYYEALSQRMLTNGFFARMIIVDTGKRAEGQDAVPADNMPKRLIETAAWWANFQPGEHRGNLIGFFPKPVTVPFSDEGKRAADDFRRYADDEYGKAEDARDEVATTVWGRANENARKLALIYACSENHAGPLIGRQAVEWATAFVQHQTRRMLFMASQHVAENPFHGECLKLLRKLRAAPDGRMSRRELMRAMRCKVNDFDQLVATLMLQGDIEAVTIPTRTKPAQGFQLA